MIKQLGSLSTLSALILLLLVLGPAAAKLAAESAEIPYQVSNSDHIVIGTVSEINVYSDHTIFTITVKEWLYNPLHENTIKIRTETGTLGWVEDQAEFTQNESVLLMLDDQDTIFNDKDIDKQLFTVFAGSLGKRPVSDRDAVIEELKAQGKWKGESQTGNNQIGSSIDSNLGTKLENIPFITPIWVIAAVLMIFMQMKKRN